MLLDIRPDHLRIVQDILKKHVPNHEVWAFGSRVKWTARDYSDLDLCVISDQPLGFTVLGDLKDDFSESDLPWKVDVVDWATTSESFRKIIEMEKVVLQNSVYCPGNNIFLWPCVPAGELFELKYGKGLVLSQRLHGSVPVYGTNGQCGWHNQSLTNGPGVILGRKGMGNLGVEWCNSDFWVIDTAYYVAQRKNDIFLKYYYYVIKHVGLNHLKDGTSNPSLSRDTFYSQLFPRPPISEQHNIAAFFSTLDDRITLLRETNATLEAIAQALFKSWFVDFDPVHAKQQGLAPEGMDEATAALFPDSFEESELGLVPKGWKVKSFNQLCNISSGKRPLERSDTETLVAKIPLYGGAGIMGFTNTSLFDIQKIVTGRVGTLGKIHIAQPPFWASDNVLVISPTRSKDFYFCFNWINGIDIDVLNRGSTQPLLTQKDLGNQQGIVPPDSLLDLFSTIIHPVYQATFQNIEQAQTLANLRDTLLPRLISGQLRLPEAEAS